MYHIRVYTCARVHTLPHAEAQTQGLCKLAKCSALSYVPSPLTRELAASPSSLPQQPSFWLLSIMGHAAEVTLV